MVRQRYVHSRSVWASPPGYQPTLGTRKINLKHSSYFVFFTNLRIIMLNEYKLIFDKVLTDIKGLIRDRGSLNLLINSATQFFIS